MALSILKDHKARWYLSGLFLLAILVFFKTLFFEFVWDDTVLLIGQASYQSVTLKQLLLTPINGVEYLPLRDLTYVSDYWLWGWNPFGFHLTNLVLYVLNIWAVYRFTLLLNLTLFSTGNNKTNDAAVWIALVTAALFTVLPLHSEVVSFIHARNVLLSGLFFFLSCTFFLRFIESGLRRYIVFSFILFTFALLSKATVIILPLILVTLMYFKPEQKPRDYAYVLPFFLLAVVFFFIFKFHATESNFIQQDLEMAFKDYGFSSKVSVALQIPFFYMAKLLLPTGLSTEYRIEFTRDLYSIIGIFAMVALGSLISMTYYFRRKFPQGLFALGWFLICLIPVLNFFLTNPAVADRYVYLSSYAYALILATVLHQLGEKAGLKLSLILLVSVLGVYSWLAFERNDVWRSELTVMEDMTRSSSNNLKGYNNLGQYYFKKKQFPKAFEYFQKAKDISPVSSQIELHQAKLAFLQNKPLEAAEILEKIQSFNDNEAGIWGLHGQIHESQGQILTALRSYQKSLNSAYSTPFSRKYASARLQYLQEKLEPSLQITRKDILAHPDDLNIKAKFAETLQVAGYQEEAISLYEDLLTLGGSRWDVYFNLGQLYKGGKQYDKSIQNFLLSLSLNSTSARIHNELGIVYKQTEKFDAALSHFQYAIKLDPDSANPQFNLARLHFQMGNNKLAREALVRIMADFPEHEAFARYYLLKISP